VKYAAYLLGAIVFSQSAFAASCDMKMVFGQPNAGGSGSAPVWEDAAHSGLVFASRLRVNTDGAKHSYSVDDFWGKTKAVNSLCNAMSDACRGLSKAQLSARALATEEARRQGWPAEALAATKLSPSIIPLKEGKPCPESDGFLISATALQNRSIQDVCDPTKYLDSSIVPALVIPKREAEGRPTQWEQRNVGVGDVAVVLSGDGEKTVFAVVGDKGPAKELGEGSIALNGELLGKTAPPANYEEVKGRNGWNVRMAFTLIFPGTRSEAAPFMTRERIEAKAREAFEKWGGIERLRACRKAFLE
jgi:hypothetical protein